MKECNFKVYVYQNGEKIINEIEEWIESLPKINYKVRVRTTINHLETQKDMRSIYFDNYTSSDNIYEVRFKFSKDLYRIFGCFGPREKEFTLLIVAKKTGGKLDPPNVIKLAEKRCELIHKDRRYTDDFV